MELKYRGLMRHLGLSDKAARSYLAAVEHGECSVLELAQISGVKRTSLYYVLEELLDAGALLQVQRGKKTRYLAESPSTLLKRAQQLLVMTDDEIIKLDKSIKKVSNKTKVYFLYGPKGFKKIWDMVFDASEKEFCIITDGKGFLDFVKEKYIINSIIEQKRTHGVRSRQIIVDSAYARSIIAKDTLENRTSRTLPASTKLPFTEIISEHFVAFISPRSENTLFIVEHGTYAQTRKVLFEELWTNLPSTAAR